MKVVITKEYIKARVFDDDDVKISKKLLDETARKMKRRALFFCERQVYASVGGNQIMAVI